MLHNLMCKRGEKATLLSKTTFLSSIKRTKYLDKETLIQLINNYSSLKVCFRKNVSFWKCKVTVY